MSLVGLAIYAVSVMIAFLLGYATAEGGSRARFFALVTYTIIALVFGALFILALAGSRLPTF